MPRISWVKRAILATSVVGGGSVLSLYCYDDVALVGGVRSMRALFTAATVIADYKWTLWWRDRQKNENSRDSLKACHQRCADRLLWLARANGSVYIKMGQFVSIMYIAPEEYKKTLSVLQDRGPHVKFSSELARQFEDELGLPASKLYTRIDETPIASASLAQVHRATTMDNEEVVVKVQYPHLERIFHSDLWAVEKLVKISEFLFPDIELDWAVEAFRNNTMHELDFELEGHSGEMTAALFNDRDDFHVPGVRWDLTSRHILTMQYVEGIKINQVSELEQAGHDLASIRKTLAEVYGEMIFCHGFIHCDPHPGNLFIRWHPTMPNQTQIVLLDHGTYRSIQPHFRSEYCKLWCHMLSMDAQGIESSSNKLGVPHRYWKYLPLIFTFRSVNSTAALGDMMTVKKRHELAEKLRDKGLADYTQFVNSLPQDLLFVLRATDMTRSLNAVLGGTTKERLYELFRAAERGRYYGGGIDRFKLVAPVHERTLYSRFRIALSMFVFRMKFWFYSTFLHQFYSWKHHQAHQSHPAS